MNENNCEKLHKPVLLEELVSSIKIYDKQNIIVDATLWMWWHAKKIIEKLNDWDIFVWFDADIKNLEVASKYLKNTFKNKNIKLYFINDNFASLSENLEKIWIKKITWIYYDFWLSSVHIDSWDRWFSFMLDWPLDMRFDKTKWITASDVINWYKKEDLIKIFKEYWEEPYARKIAEEIIKKRKNKFKFQTTKDLSNFLEGFTKNIKIKTKIFQALRIEVNKELDNIKKSLLQAIELLDKWWIIFAISFHSLEDRIVKNIFRDESKDCICNELICKCNHKAKLKILSKKPIVPSQKELEENIRSRSAKARFAEKI